MSQAASPPDTYLNSNLFSGYYLDERVADLDAWDCDDEAQAALEQLQATYNQEGGLLPSYKEEDVLSKWIDEVLDVLGFDSLSETNVTAGRGEIDRTLFASSQDRIDAAHLRQDGNLNGMYGKSVALLEAKKWDTDFEKRFNEERQYRDASHQIKFYLERTPEDVKWGILTDGRKWRLYGTKDYETQTYYEIDLPELIESGSVEQFKYFYVFFRAAAFEEIGGSTFLDEVWNEAETAAQELGEDLQDNVFTALRVLGEGFVEKNDLQIDPDDDVALDELKEQSLVLLYRLMFILYAESRGLIDPDSPQAEDEYRSNFSLEVLRDDILEEIDNAQGFDEVYSSYSTTMWSRMEDLFRLIDSGEQELGIPAYNGGLFDHDQHAFLTENEISNRHLAEVIYRLSTTQADDGSYVPADYADLDTRHLGTIYEGLLEHEFRIAPEEYAAVSEDGGQVWKPATEVTVADAVESVGKGELYVVNDEGERKATGAYYTPDYVVTYIVEETIDPLLEDIEDDLREEGFEPGTEPYVYAFADRVLELKVLDPAMGSGHFLTKATGYLADAVMQEVRKVEKVAGVFDEQDVRRRVSKECIYGVDLNGMAVELAKLSMWLETLAADQPLAFLDHHLKSGNSLFGSDIKDVLSEEDSTTSEGQLTLQQSFAHTRQQALEHVMKRFQDLLTIDNETLEDIKKMEAVYEEMQSDPLYRRLTMMANVHTVERFGFNVPSDAYERMAKALRDEEWIRIENQEWFKTAQTVSTQEQVFHWELEFPDVFYQKDGSLQNNPGFDAVIGNPPYIESKQLTTDRKDKLSKFFDTCTGKFDLYIPFMELALQLSKRRTAYILPSMFMKRGYGEKIRRALAEETYVDTLVDFKDIQVFDAVTNFTCILITDDYDPDSIRYLNVPNTSIYPEQIVECPEKRYTNHATDHITSDQWDFSNVAGRKALNTIRSTELTLSDVTEKISVGIQTGKASVFLVEQETMTEYGLENKLWKPLVRGRDISRWTAPQFSSRVFYPYNKDGKPISQEKIKTQFPATYRYLIEHKSELESRTTSENTGKEWYELWRPRNIDLFENEEKILVQQIASSNTFCVGERGVYFNTKVYGIVPSEGTTSNELLALLNSPVAEFEYQTRAATKRGGHYEYTTDYLSKIPIPKISEERLSDESIKSVKNHLKEYPGVRKALRRIVDDIIKIVTKRSNIDVDILTYVRNYNSGGKIADYGIYRPVSEKNILDKTSDDLNGLRIGDIGAVKTSSTSVQIKATARYKPEEKEDVLTDRWGYTETEYIAAFDLFELSETEADLISEFISNAARRLGKETDFYEKATKKTTLTDRLQDIVTPDPEEVSDDLNRFINAKKRAESLDSQRANLESLVNQIVYDLYGLSNDEIDLIAKNTSNK